MILSDRAAKRATGVAALLTLIGCSSQGRVPQAASPRPSPPTQSSTPVSSPQALADSGPSWLTVDSAARTAILALAVSIPEGTSSAMLNGYRAGAARIIIPLGWTVRWNWRNADSSSPHSLVVMVQREKMALEGGRAAFSNAMTRMVTTGLPLGAIDQTTFVADEAGWYWLMCGVPGHALKGEWLELRLDPEAKVPAVQVKKSEE
jgi:hypothetical protein